MKKVLALVLAFAMMFSTITVAFAETEVSAEAKALATVGMLEGDGNGVTAEYTAKEMTRFTAAISLLKLKGLYNDALAFKGDANFADVDTVKWEEGKNILAYLKANPGLGFGGNEKGEFNPNGNINEQSYYKVLLETLGYKQTTAEVAGDFAWAETLEFAAKVGLKPVNATPFTVDSLAKATVAALKANMKDGKVLINVLVDAGKVDKAKAIAAALYEEVVVTASLKSAKAIGNTVVEVEFTEAVPAAYAENLANYAIEGLEIKSAMLDGTKKVLLETAGQTAGKVYTLVVGEVKVNFGGKAKITGAPELKAVSGPDTERVKLEFDKVLNTQSALDVANYAIANVTVKSAKLDSARKVVTLTTEGLTANKTHTVKVTNLSSVDGYVLKSASKNFFAKTDKVAPKVSSIKSDTNTRVIVVFDEEVTAESAEDIANYTIKAGTTEVAIEKAELVADADDDMTTVELTTVAQKSGTRHTLTVNNITDVKVLANTMTKAESKTYYPVAEDTQAPSYVKFEYMTKNLVKVTFSDKSRLDKETVLDITNYTFNNDVTVEKAELFDEDDKTNSVVKLTVSELGAKTSYELKIAGIRDEYANEMKETKKVVVFNKAIVNTAATVEKAVATANDTVKVYFTKEVDKASAQDVANYTINNDINAPVTASLDSSAKVVTLKTATLTAGKTYTLTINGVKDLADNVLNVKPKFVGISSDNDIEAPTVEYVEVINKKVVRVTFNEAVDTSSAKKPVLVFGTVDATTGVFTPAVSPTATYATAVDSAATTVEFTVSPVFTSEANTFVEVTAYDKAGNKVVKAEEVYTLTNDPDKVELLSWEQSSVREFKLIYSENVKLINPATDTIAAGVGIPYTLTISTDDDDETIVYLTANQRMAVDKEFKLQLTSYLVSYHGEPVVDPDTDGSNKRTIITTAIEDTDAPYIESVVATDKRTVKVTYSEDLSKLGSYGIKYVNDKGNEVKWTVNGTADSNANVVKLTMPSDLESKYVYTLSIATQAEDLSYNKVDKDTIFDFVGTDVVGIANYIAGVNVVNGSKFEVVPYSAVNTGATVTLVYGDNNTVVTLVNPPTEVKNTSGKVTKYVVELAKDASGKPFVALGKDVEYKVSVSGITGTYSFKGIVETGVTVEKDATNSQYIITYSDIKSTDNVYFVGTSGTAVAATVDASGTFFKLAYTGFTENIADIVVVTAEGVTLFYEVAYTLN